MTNEPEGPTEKWVKEKGPKYPYAYDAGGKLERAIGEGGLPNAVLVDPGGTIVWQGHPGSLTEAIIEEHLGGAFAKPLFEWPDAAKPVAKAVAKRQFGKAIEEADKLASQDEEVAAIATSLQGIVEARVKAVEAARDAGDFLQASESAKAIEKQCAGLPAAEKAAEIAKAIGADPEAKRVIKGQTAVRKLRQTEVKSAKDAAEVSKKAEKIANEFEGTAAAREAEAVIADMKPIIEQG